MKEIFTKHKKNIIVALGVVVIASVAIFGYNSYSSNKVKQQSVEFKEILDMLVTGSDEDVAQASEKLNELQENGNKGFKTLAYLTEFKNYLLEEDNEKAKETLHSLIADGKVPAVYKDMSKYYLAVIYAKEDNFELADKTIDEVANNSKSDFYISALLLSVNISIKNQDFDKALRNAELIINNRVANPQIIQLASSIKYYIIAQQAKQQEQQ